MGGSPPPTVRGIPQSSANPYVSPGRSAQAKKPAAKKKDGKGGAGPNTRGMNRGGKVNTNISTGGNSNPESALMTRAHNIQS